MIAANGHDAGSSEIAHALASAVTAAVDAARAGERGTHSIAWTAAAGVADLLELKGLVALLAACEKHANAPPLTVSHVLERLARLAAETESAGRTAPFVAADRELEALAGMIHSQEWTAPTPADPTPVELHSLSGVLAEFAVDNTPSLAESKVTLPVAATLRAALEWLGAGAGERVRAAVQDAALTLSLRVTNGAALPPAGALLGLVGGALLPESDGRWTLRVPLHVPRPAFLLARQGILPIALPWHAIARLRILDDAARAVMPEPSLAPWSPLARVLGERPAALLAHGLNRAWLHLDHIVWRVFASPEPVHAPAAVPGARTCVRTEDGSEFWVVDVNAALDELSRPLAATGARPQPQPREQSAALRQPAAPAPAAPVPTVTPVPPARSAPAAAVAAARAVPVSPVPAASEPAPFAPDLVVLTSEHVIPRGTKKPSSLRRALAGLIATGRLPASEKESTSQSGVFVSPSPEDNASAMRPAAPPVEPAAARDVRRPTSQAFEPTPAPFELDPRDAMPHPGGQASAGTPAMPPPPAEPAARWPKLPDIESLRSAMAAPVTAKARRALVVDDSLVTRMALGRALERAGFVVEGVERASEMWTALETSKWAVVFVDVFLPDASGRAHLRELVAYQITARERFEIVALTRDNSERRLADDAGIARALQKPFATGVLDELIRSLPAPPGSLPPAGA